MAKPSFNTVATELLEHAEVVYEHFRGLGYNVKVEPMEAHYPARPTFICRRDHTVLAILVFGRFDMVLLNDWVSLAKSLKQDFRIVICIPKECSVKQLPKHQLDCNKLGIGVYVSADGQLQRLQEPSDQNINVVLPDLGAKPRRVRKTLGTAYEHVQAGRWREGFEEACKALEQDARPYLERAIDAGRLTIYKNGKPKNPTVEQIRKMTLGQLGVAFADAQPLNSTDTHVSKALTQINADRVGVAHKNKQASTERRLRKNVGLNMHIIVRAITELHK